MKKNLIKKKKTPKNVELRVSKIELEFATHNAVCSERYKNQKETLDRIEKTIKRNSEAIEKLFGISNKGLGAIKVLIVIGTVIGGAFSFFKLKDLSNLSTELINEYKDQVKSLGDKVKELYKQLEDKDAKIKRQLILLEQKDQDIYDMKEKITKTKEELNKL